MEFASLGAHCAHPGCNQQDFLPFKCEDCGASYCLDHRTAAAHECPAAGRKAEALAAAARERQLAARLAMGETSPKKKKKKRCPVKGCRAKGLTVSMRCRDCGVEFCPSHRFEDQHVCAGMVCRPTGKVASVTNSGAAAMARAAATAAATAASAVVASCRTAVGPVSGSGNTSTGRANAVAAAADDESVAQLVGMGFSVSAARAALAATSGVEQAVAHLLAVGA